MATNTTKAVNRGKLAFDLELQGTTIRVDADPAVGGEDYGPRPKPLVLSSLAGCTGMDVASILGKMKVHYESFELEVEGDLAERHPKTYTAIRLRYIFTGNDLDRDKIRKAIDLSLENYCGVAAMLKSAGASVDYEIVINP
ncbi:MAG: OsmC family protein [Spirochaetota bacterium]